MQRPIGWKVKCPKCNHESITFGLKEGVISPIICSNIPIGWMKIKIGDKIYRQLLGVSSQYGTTDGKWLFTLPWGGYWEKGEDPIDSEGYVSPNNCLKHRCGFIWRVTPKKKKK